MSDTLPDLPTTDLAEIRNPYTGEATVSETGTAYYGSHWYEVRKLYTAEQMREYALAARQQQVPEDLCERICAAIKAADDKSVDEAGYMLDSNDCIAIVREQFAAAPQAAQPEQAQQSEREAILARLEAVPVPDHPEPWAWRWSDSEQRAISNYRAAMLAAAGKDTK